MITYNEMVDHLITRCADLLDDAADMREAVDDLKAEITRLEKHITAWKLLAEQNRARIFELQQENKRLTEQLTDKAHEELYNRTARDGRKFRIVANLEAGSPFSKVEYEEKPVIPQEQSAWDYEYPVKAEPE
jgi:hypothetical protein